MGTCLIMKECAIQIGLVMVSRPRLYARTPPIQNLGETEVAWETRPQTVLHSALSHAYSPDGFLMGPDGFLMGPDGFLMGPDGSLMGPDRSLMGPDRSLMGPDGSLVGPDGFLMCC